MKSLPACFLTGLLVCLAIYAANGDQRASASETASLDIAKLDPNLDHKEVTIKFVVKELGGVAQRDIPGKARVFIIEATSDHKHKDLNIWIEEDLAEVLDRLQLSYFGNSPIKKGTIIVATGLLTYSPGAGERKGHEWYTLNVGKWQNFRIIAPDK